MIGVMTLDEQWAGTWAADHAAELSATGMWPFQGFRVGSQAARSLLPVLRALGPAAPCPGLLPVR